MQVSRTILRAALPALLLTAAPALRADEAAEALLRHVASVYRGASAYEFVAAEQTVTKSGPIEKSARTLVLTARDDGGRLRVEFDDGASGGVAVFDGRENWVYLPATGRYAKLPAPTSAATQQFAKAGGIDFSSYVKRYVDRYGITDQRIIQATIDRRESVELSHGAVDCQIVNVSYTPPPGLREGKIDRVYWVNVADGLIVRERSTASLFHEGLGRRVEVTQDIEFQTARAGGSPPDELFRFIPPKGVQQVESFRPDAVEENRGVDTEAPDFTLENLAGDPVQLSSMRGNVVLLDFWATWCGPCRYDMPFVEELYRELKDQGLRVFGINAELPKRAGAYMEKNGFELPSLFDPGMRVAQMFSVRAIPTFVVIDRQGRMRSYFRGTRSKDQLRQAIMAAGL